MITRGRTYESGVPLPLDIAGAILNYLKIYDSPVDVAILAECIIAIDNLFIDNAYKKIEQDRKMRK